MHPHFHLLTEGHSTDMELAQKTAVEYTDAMAKAAVTEAKMTLFDMFQMYGEMVDSKSPAKFFKRWYQFKNAMERK